MKISFMDLLLLIFITLKLCGVISWSWWVVLIPLWFEIVILIFYVVLKKL